MQEQTANPGQAGQPFFRMRMPLVRRENPAELTETLWIKCPGCRDLTYIKEYERNLKVCKKCQHHARLNWRERLASLLEPGSFVELNDHLVPGDPLGFQTGSETYVQKVASTSRKSGLTEALITGYGRIKDQPLAVAVSDFAFLGASMGSVYGEKLVRLIDYAIENRLPLLTISASGGARMHEGLFSLMQLAKTTAALVRLGKESLPHVALLVDPCYGGVTASYTMVADAIVAEPGALIGFAGPRVIEQTTRQRLPEGFQTAEFLLEHGMLDAVTPRHELPGVIANLFDLFKQEKPAVMPNLVALAPHSEPDLNIVRLKLVEETSLEELDYAS